MAKPALSIITVNLNNASGLQRTIDSVCNQTFTDFEYLIIDGGSDDESKEVIRKNSNELSYWISEKDSGVYNAMNKGIKNAQGEYLLFLNAGDYFTGNDVLTLVFREKVLYDIVYGNVKWIPEIIYIPGTFPDKLSFEYFINNSLPHQGSFLKRTLFETIGLYDESHKIISDWKFFLLAVCKFNCSYKHVNIEIAVCTRDGISVDPSNLPQMKIEREQVIQQYFPAFEADYNSLQLMRKELRKIKGMMGYRLYDKFRKLLGK